MVGMSRKGNRIMGYGQTVKSGIASQSGEVIILCSSLLWPHLVCSVVAYTPTVYSFEHHSIRRVRVSKEG